MAADSDMGPLKGCKVVEIAGIGPAPVAGMILADLGAEVILVERKTSNPNAATVYPTHMGNAAFPTPLHSLPGVLDPGKTLLVIRSAADPPAVGGGENTGNCLGFSCFRGSLVQLTRRCSGASKAQRQNGRIRGK